MRNPLTSIFKPIQPVQPPPQPIQMSRPVQFNLDEDEKPWPIWQFVLEMVILLFVWLVAKPIMDDLVDQLIEPLTIAPWLDLFYNILVYILFGGLIWIGFRKTFKNGGS